MKLKSRLRYYIRTGCWIEGKEERIDEVVNIAVSRGKLAMAGFKDDDYLTAVGPTRLSSSLLGVCLNCSYKIDHAKA